VTGTVWRRLATTQSARRSRAYPPRLTKLDLIVKCRSTTGYVAGGGRPPPPDPHRAGANGSRLPTGGGWRAPCGGVWPQLNRPGGAGPTRHSSPSLTWSWKCRSTTGS